MTNFEKFIFLERCSELFQTKRMEHIQGPIQPQNSVYGLYELIQTYFNENFIMAEIGSFKGTSTRFFSLFVNKIYSIDIYDYHVPPTGRIAEMDAGMIEAEKTFLERTVGYDNIIKIKKDSKDAANDFQDNSLDCVYIDGEHLYDYIWSDVNAWKNKVKNGGILCGHDYDQYHANDIENILNEFNLMNEFKTYSDTSWSVVIKK